LKQNRGSQLINQNKYDVPKRQRSEKPLIAVNKSPDYHLSLLLNLNRGPTPQNKKSAKYAKLSHAESRAEILIKCLIVAVLWLET
jgi:hypothetical protein